MAENTTQEDRMQLLTRMQTIEEQLKHLMEQAQLIEKQGSDLESAEQALTELQNQSEADTLIQVASGVFVKAHVQDFSKLLVNVGAGIIAEKKREDVVQQIAEQRQSLMQVQLHIEEQQQSLLQTARTLQMKLIQQQEN